MSRHHGSPTRPSVANHDYCLQQQPYKRLNATSSTNTAVGEDHDDIGAEPGQFRARLGDCLERWPDDHSLLVRAQVLAGRHLATRT